MANTKKLARICLLAFAFCIFVSVYAASSRGHTNNWAVLVCTSRFWFNYRHVANTLSVYHTVKRLGIPDSQIILMLADDMACNSRNIFPGTIFNTNKGLINLYGEDVEVDYRGYEVTVENFMRVMTGRHDSNVPRSKRLLTDSKSNILLYMSGHGGDGFLKFQDSDEITSLDLADTFQQMWTKRRYNELFFIVDTCQAASLGDLLHSPNVVFFAGAKTGQDSYGYSSDTTTGVTVMDRFTYFSLNYLEKVGPGSTKRLTDYFAFMASQDVLSTPSWRTTKLRRPVSNMRLLDFFSSVVSVSLDMEPYPLASVSDGQEIESVNSTLPGS